MTHRLLRWQNRLWQVRGLNRQVLIFFLYSLIFHISLFGITDVLLNFYLVSIGYDPEAISTFQAIPRFSGFLTGLPVGLIANRIGKRRIIILSTYGVALCTVGVVLAPSALLISVSRFFWGFFFGAGQVVKPPYMVTLTHRDEHTAQFAYHNLISMTAVSLGSAIGGFMPLLVSSLFSMSAIGDIPAEQTPSAYQGAILFACVLIVISVFPLYRLPKDDVSQVKVKAKKKNSDANTPWLHLLKLSSPLFLFGISGGLTFPFFNLFFREQFGIADNIVGTVIALGWLGMALAPLMNPAWERRVGRANALTWLMVISAIAFFGLGLAQLLIVAVPLYMIGIGIRNTMQPLYQPMLMDSLPDNLHNLASSIGLVLWNIGWFGATLAFGWLQAVIDFDGIMFVVAVFVLLNGLSIFLVFDTARNSPDDNELSASQDI